MKDRLKPQPWDTVHAFEWILDPWHPEAFVGCGRLIEEQVRATNPNPGTRQRVLAMVDYWGNVIGMYPTTGHEGQTPILEKGVWYWPEVEIEKGTS